MVLRPLRLADQMACGEVVGAHKKAKPPDDCAGKMLGFNWAAMWVSDRDQAIAANFV